MLWSPRDCKWPHVLRFVVLYRHTQIRTCVACVCTTHISHIYICCLHSHVNTPSSVHTWHGLKADWTTSWILRSRHTHFQTTLWAHQNIQRGTTLSHKFLDCVLFSASHVDIGRAMSGAVLTKRARDTWRRCIGMTLCRRAPSLPTGVTSGTVLTNRATPLIELDISDFKWTWGLRFVLSLPIKFIFMCGLHRFCRCVRPGLNVVGSFGSILTDLFRRSQANHHVRIDTGATSLQIIQSSHKTSAMLSAYMTSM